MPRQSSELGYECPNCGLDFGFDDLIRQRSTRKRGQKTHVLSRRRTEAERISFKKLDSMPVENEPNKLLMARYECKWLDEAADRFMKYLNDGTWYSLPVPVQEIIIKRISEVKKRTELRKKAEQDIEFRYTEWGITLTKEDSPFYKLAMKISALYRIEDKSTGNGTEIIFNPAAEILRYRLAGDPLVYRNTSEVRQIRVLYKYPMLAQRIRNGPKYSLMEKGSKVLNRYREPFSNKKWLYPWIEQFWIVLCASLVSAREASRMLRVLDGQGSRRLSTKQIKNRVAPVTTFWQNFFEYLPHYIAYLDTIESFIRNDPELSECDQREQVECDTINEGLTSAYYKEAPKQRGRLGLRQVTHLADSHFGIRKVTWASKQMIRVWHPNLKYDKEMDEYKKGLRSKKPQRKTSCYFDPWKQSQYVLGALIKKGKIHFR